MLTTITRATELRKQSKYQESRDLLQSLLGDDAFSAKAHLHVAWAYDNEGQERQAAPHYLAALEGALSPTERFDALLGLASTYRSLGMYEEALAYFEHIMTEYPDSIEVQPFYAMCLYNTGRHKDATALLLKLLVSTTKSDSIRSYRQAIELYAKDLDKTW